MNIKVDLHNLRTKVLDLEIDISIGLWLIRNYQYQKDYWKYRYQYYMVYIILVTLKSQYDICNIGWHLRPYFKPLY